MLVVCLLISGGTDRSSASASGTAGPGADVATATAAAPEHAAEAGHPATGDAAEQDRQPAAAGENTGTKRRLSHHHMSIAVSTPEYMYLNRF